MCWWELEKLLAGPLLPNPCTKRLDQILTLASSSLRQNTWEDAAPEGLTGKAQGCQKKCTVCSSQHRMAGEVPDLSVRVLTEELSVVKPSSYPWRCVSPTTRWPLSPGPESHSFEMQSSGRLCDPQAGLPVTVGGQNPRFLNAVKQTQLTAFTLTHPV